MAQLLEQALRFPEPFRSRSTRGAIATYFIKLSIFAAQLLEQALCFPEPFRSRSTRRAITVYFLIRPVKEVTFLLYLLKKINQELKFYYLTYSLR